MNEPLATLSRLYITAVEQELRDVLRTTDRAGDPYYAMMHYHMGWVDDSFRHLETNGGKRIRPILCLLTCQASGADWQRAVPAAASLELLHNFSLVHDDIQDASPTRRGRSTVWQLWGVGPAINVGDGMYALAHLAMARLSERGIGSDVVVQALRRLDETCVDLTVGQHADMKFESRQRVGVQEYLAMIGGKTAALISLATELGALVGGSSPATVEHFSAYGRDLGLAFQVRDDILGIWGDESVIGKSAATDISTRKKSLPVLFGLERNAELRRLYAGPDGGDDFVARAVELLDSVGAQEFAREHEQRYADSALAHLEAAEPQGVAGAALFQLTGWLLHRQL
jgi:geranylgeranyl diphosphate synthase, type I